MRIKFQIDRPKQNEAKQQEDPCLARSEATMQTKIRISDVGDAKVQKQGHDSVPLQSSSRTAQKLLLLLVRFGPHDPSQVGLGPLSSLNGRSEQLLVEHGGELS